MKPYSVDSSPEEETEAYEEDENKRRFMTALAKFAAGTPDIVISNDGKRVALHPSWQASPLV